MKKAVLVASRKTPLYLTREFETLARVAGYEIVGKIVIRPRGSKHRLTHSKLEEIIQEIKAREAEYVLVQPDLPPSDILLLRKNTRKEIVDRTLLLLEVFERNAGSKEAKLQIQVARMKHELPFIKELVNRAKRGELPGFLAGGAYAVDRHYRHVRKKVAEYNTALEKLRLQRRITRKRRRKSGFISVAIVGYANAGKTTLFNKLTGSSKQTGNTPFTTITPKTARSSRGAPIVYTDTVGFVSNVPAEIIDAFHATLEEITFSDIIVYVLDITEDTGIIEKRLGDSFHTLRKIGAIDKPLIIFLNKVDECMEEKILEKIIAVRKHTTMEYPSAIFILKGSAKDAYTAKTLEDVLWRLVELRLLSSESATGQKETRELLATSH